MEYPFLQTLEILTINPPVISSEVKTLGKFLSQLIDRCLIEVIFLFETIKQNLRFELSSCKIKNFRTKVKSSIASSG